MTNTPSRSRLAAVAASLLLAGGFALQAGETNVINNSNFDNLAPTPSWYWENWSLAGSTNFYDSSLDAGGGAVGSGSLRLVAPFVANTNWQQAIFTLDCTDFDASVYYSFSFDVKVDPTSTLRAEGDYGFIHVILRDGGNWDWRELAFVTLTNTGWQRVTCVLTNGSGGAIPLTQLKNIRAITLQLAQNDHVGPVRVNVDNFAFNDEVVIDNFDDLDAAGWIADWGTQAQPAFGALDYYGRVSSGTLQVTDSTFTPDAPAGGWEQTVVNIPLGATIDAFSLYSHVNLDVKFDSSSAQTAATNYGLFEVKTSNGGATIGGLTVTDTNWIHLHLPLGPSLGSFNALLLQLGNANILGPIKYNVDNLTWTPRPAVAAPPTLGIRRSDKTGLKITAGGTGNFQRDNIAAIAPAAQAQWIGSPDPMTYSLTIAEMPLNNSFQVHLFLVPNSGTSGDTDWNDANIVFLDIRQNADGTGFADLRHKTNAPGANSQLYGPGILTRLNVPTSIGTWSLRFVNDTNITVSGPGGATTNVVMPPDNAAFFAGPITASVGIQPGVAANLGESATFSRITFTSGSTTNLDDQFTTVFDPTQVDPDVWQRRQGNGGDINGITVSLNTGWLVSWLIPDVGFYLTASSNLTSWYYPDVTPSQAGATKRALIPDNALPSATSGYFRLVNTNSP